MKPKFSIGDILPVVITIIVIGIGAAYGLSVLSDVKADFTASSIEANATQDAIDGVAKIPEKLPLIVTVVVAAIVIGILVRYLVMR